LAYVETAFYYRQSTDTLSFYRSFYAQNNKLYFEGNIINAIDTSDIGNLYSGLCKWFYLNGNIKTECEYNSNGFIHGFKKDYDESGRLKKFELFENGKNNSKESSEYDSLGNKSLIFDENFSDNAQNWSIDKQSATSSKIKIGGLELINNSKTDYGIFSNKKNDSLNFDIEAIINFSYLNGDCKTGLIFGFKDWNNYHYFLATKYRIYIGSIINGKEIKEIEDFFPSNMKGINMNALKVKSVKDSLYYFINNELQIITRKKIFPGNFIGLYVLNGITCIDNFKIAQYSKSYKISLTCSLLPFHEFMTSVKHIYTGIFVTQDGYILTSIKNIDQINGLQVLLSVNDSLKEYIADIVFKDVLLDYTILKIRNHDNLVFPKLYYKCTQLTSIDSEKNFILAFYRSKTSGNFNTEILNTNLKTEDNKAIQVFNNILIGSPIFNEFGDILGLYNGMDTNSKVKTVKIHHVINALFLINKKLDIKKTSDVLPDQFKKEIVKDLVLIKTI
jgi:hypothetical protein